MVFDLEGGDGVAGVGLEVEEGLGLGVGDSDGFGDAGVDGFFEGFPCLAEGDVLELYGGVGGVLPPSLVGVSFLAFLVGTMFGEDILDSESFPDRRI